MAAPMQQMMPNTVPNIGNMQMQPQQLPPQQMQQQQGDLKLDNITKVKSLLIPLRDSLANVMKAAAQNFSHNSTVDSGSLKANDIPPALKFEKCLEEFYSVCDQMEMHLNTTLKCVSQSQSSQRYIHLSVNTSRPDNAVVTDTLSYTQYMTTVRNQVSFAKEIHDALSDVVQGLASNE